ncbi:MAG: ATP-binding cassette domain-containing protein [Arsenophonus sp.]|nr:MAG: ATP-binding cassette domain-containing protein [Arsenophonus sp.]
MNCNSYYKKPNLLVHNITVIYKNGHLAVRDVSFNLNGGLIYALVGINGSGKSTIFKTIMGLIKPVRGYVKLNNYSINKAIKHNIISYVPQTEDIDWDFPVLVYDVVMMGRYGKMGFLRIPTKKDKQIVSLSLKKVGLNNLKERQIGELSGGQKKRVFIARALAQEGKVLLLDEPFTGIDVKTENSIIQILLELRKMGYLILVSTHNLGSIPQFCDQIILVNQTILNIGPVSTTFTKENLKLAFGNTLRHIDILNTDLDHNNFNSLSIVTDDEKAAVFYKYKK